MNNLVSVIVSVKNGEPYLNKLIESIIKQTYSNWELLIFNDGSTDRSLEIISSYRDPRIKLFSENKSAGLPARLNFLINQSKGRFIARMDADDIMFPNRLSLQVEYLLNNLEFDVIGAGAISIDLANKIVGRRNALKHNTVQKVIMNGFFIHPTVFGKREWFVKNKYSTLYNRAEDIELWVRSFNHSRFSNMDIPVIFYREGEINVRNYVASNRSVIKIARDYKNRYLSQSDYLKIILKCFLKIISYKLFSIFELHKFLSSLRSNKLDVADKAHYMQLLASI